jgi:hypothetical protein
MVTKEEIVMEYDTVDNRHKKRNWFLVGFVVGAIFMVSAYEVLGVAI